jgi:hypothetical protein
MAGNIAEGALAGGNFKDKSLSTELARTAPQNRIKGAANDPSYSQGYRAPTAAYNHNLKSFGEGRVLYLGPFRTIRIDFGEALNKFGVDIDLG